MKDWIIKRFCLFVYERYEEGTGLEDLEFTAPTLKSVKKYIDKELHRTKNTAVHWMVVDLKIGKTILTSEDNKDLTF